MDLLDVLKFATAHVAAAGGRTQLIHFAKIAVGNFSRQHFLNLEDVLILNLAQTMVVAVILRC